jgi:hypothetical protein
LLFASQTQISGNIKCPSENPKKLKKGHFATTASSIHHKRFQRQSIFFSFLNMVMTLEESQGALHQGAMVICDLF